MTVGIARAAGKAIYRRLPGPVRRPVAWTIAVLRAQRAPLTSDRSAVELDVVTVTETDDLTPRVAQPGDTERPTDDTAIAVTPARDFRPGELLRERGRNLGGGVRTPNSGTSDSTHSSPRQVGFDTRALQSAHHQHRGIGRYVYESLSAQARMGAEERGFVARYYFDVDVPSGRRLERFNELTPIDPLSAAVPGPVPDLWHITSPMEPDWGVDQLFPAPFRRSLLAVTCFDLIPLLMPDRYLPTEGARRSYSDRLELVRQADLVLCISQSTADDVRERLDVRASRIAVVGAGVSPDFNATPDADFEALLDNHLGDVRRYLFLVGGEDPRKNLERGIDAFAALPASLRNDLHLVIGGLPQAGLAPPLAALTDRLAITERVIGLGRVSDRALKAIYQQAALVVFPSEYEGFGFPAVEALRCGTEVLVSNTSSLKEVVPDPDRRFDPTDTRSITDCIVRQLTGTPTSASERTQWLLPHSWDAVARRTAAELNHLVSSKGNSRLRRSARLAVVSPLPPARTGVADYVNGLRAGFSSHVSTTFFGADGASNALPFSSFDDWEAVHGSFDGVLVQIGNNEAHLPALDLLRRHPGRCTVEVHDARLIGLYDQEGVRAGDTSGTWVACAIRQIYGDRYVERVRSANLLDAAVSNRLGVWLIREVATLSRCVVVHNELARSVVLRECPTATVHVVPLAILRRKPAELKAFSVVTAGVVAATKGLDRLLLATSHVAKALPYVHLTVLGSGSLETAVGSSFRPLLELRATRALVETGFVGATEYLDTLGSAAVVVQLRSTTNGESSAAVADAIGLGRPVVGDRHALLGAPAEAVELIDGSVASIADALMNHLSGGKMPSPSWISDDEHAATRSPQAIARELARLTLERPKQ